MHFVSDTTWSYFAYYSIQKSMSTFGQTGILRIWSRFSLPNGVRGRTWARYVYTQRPDVQLAVGICPVSIRWPLNGLACRAHSGLFSLQCKSSERLLFLFFPAFVVFWCRLQNMQRSMLNFAVKDNCYDMKSMKTGWTNVNYIVLIVFVLTGL